MPDVDGDGGPYGRGRRRGHCYIIWKATTTLDVQKILVPVDCSSDSHQALQWGASLAEKYGAKPLLLHVHPKAVEQVHPQDAARAHVSACFYDGISLGRTPFGTQLINIDMVDRAQTELADFAVKHLKAPVPMQVNVAVGTAAEEILRGAREEHVDLIIMGTHGRTSLLHLLLGSVAEEVIRHALCPVFSVRMGVEAAA